MVTILQRRITNHRLNVWMNLEILLAGEGAYTSNDVDQPSSKISTGKRRKKTREVYSTVSVSHVTKNTENGQVLSISVKAPKWLNYAIINIHKETSCQCIIKDIFPLGTTQHKRSHDLNRNVNKVSKQCDIATNLSQSDI